MDHLHPHLHHHGVFFCHWGAFQRQGDTVAGERGHVYARSSERRPGGASEKITANRPDLQHRQETEETPGG